MPLLRRELKRNQIVLFFSKLAATEVVLEACGQVSSLGTRAGGTGASGPADPGAICQTLRQTQQE